MPFTPFHMGPGLLVKAVAGRHFSILTFGIAQVAMDIEPLMGLMRGATVLHGPTHTYPAACVIRSTRRGSLTPSLPSHAAALEQRVTVLPFAAACRN